jgi:lysophospholipase L1-like esterase
MTTATSDSSWLQRHPWAGLLLVNGVILGALLIAAELFLRVYVPYNPGYYVSVSGNDREVQYPYGTIRINSQGFPDGEFDLSKDLRVGYFGDSVTYGVGAGHGYRVSDLLEPIYPQYEHMNFGGIGLSVSDNEIEMFLRLADRFALDEVVYLFNLNDIVPDRAVSGGTKPPARRVRRLMPSLDVLRGRSYVYTWLRTRLKNLLEARGVGFHGYQASELFPQRERAAIDQTAGRIQELQRRLAAAGPRLTVVLLPYEMQISEEAERIYASKGIHWEDGFLERGTQEAMIEALGPQMRVIDGYFAFVDPEDPEASRARNAVGEYFVFDKGDKLDWNHPNRAGHRALADHLAAQGILPAPGERAPDRVADAPR